MSDNSDAEIKEMLGVEAAVAQLSTKFLLGHEKSQIKHKEGIVFIGNSRIGKSTISAIISGLEMRLVLSGKEFKIEPKDIQFRKNKNVIQHTMTSVTEFPNIYQPTINGQKYTVVDLPGFKDTSYQKELCNWHYIKSILQQLDKILFVMVLQVHPDTKQVEEYELEMMQRFFQAFPCKKNQISKRNLVTVINFMENLEQENNQETVKSEIKEKIKTQLGKLKQDKLQEFYNRSFDSDRLFLMEKIKKKANSQKQIKDGGDYENPRLLEFIKKNLFLMEQTEHSTFKINLTLEVNDQSKKLKKVLETITQKIFKEIAEKVGVYKNMLTNLISRLTETEGVVCGDKDYKELRQYSIKKKLNVYDKVGLYLSSTLEMDFKKEQEIVYEIISHFYSMILASKKEMDFKQRVELVSEGSLKFINLMESLCKILFKDKDFDNVEDINQNMRKAIYIDCYNLGYIYESVENFTYTEPDFDFYVFCCDGIEQLVDKIKKMNSFKNELKDFLAKAFKRYEQNPGKKLNIKNLEKLQEVCDILDFRQIKTDTAILVFKQNQKKILQIQISSDPEVFKLLDDEKPKANMKKEELDKLNEWKKTNPEWQMIKNKQAVQFLKILKSIKGKAYDAAEFYLKLDSCFQDLMDLVKAAVDEGEKNGGTNKRKAFDLCMKVADHFGRYHEYVMAEKCCGLGMKLYIFEDANKFIEAKLKSIELKNKSLQPLDRAKVQQELLRQPWVSMRDEDHEKLKELVMESRDKVEEDKNIHEMPEMFMKSISSSSKSVESPEKQNEKVKPQVQIGESPLRSPKATLLRDDDDRKSRKHFKKY